MLFSIKVFLGIPIDKVLSKKSINPFLKFFSYLFGHISYICKANKPEIETVVFIKSGIIFTDIVFIIISKSGKL